MSQSQKHHTRLDFTEYIRKPTTGQGPGDKEATGQRSKAKESTVQISNDNKALGKPTGPAGSKRDFDALNKIPEEPSRKPHTTVTSSNNKLPVGDRRLFEENYRVIIENYPLGKDDLKIVRDIKAPKNAQAFRFIVPRFGDDAHSDMTKVYHLEHENVLQVLYSFDIEKSGFFIVLEFVELCLDDISTVSREQQVFEQSHLAIIFRQIVDGLLYLTAQDLDYFPVNCLTIFINSYGNVKIWPGRFNESPGQGAKPAPASQIGDLTVEFVQGSPREDGDNMGLKFGRLASMPLFVDFVGQARTVDGAERLNSLYQHKFLGEHHGLSQDSLRVSLSLVMRTVA